ncbi:MAG: PKD domain-containing protein [Saprospiraceae bacterium]
MKKLSFILGIILFLFSQNLFSQMPSAEERSVQLSATVETNPAKINLTWKADVGASKYIVYRKSLEATSWGNPIANLPGSATSYIDENVVVGEGYEYAFFKEDFAPRVDTVCIPSGTQVNFSISDMYGIGLCCSFGLGYYEVKNCDVVQAEGDDFGMNDSAVFTTCDDGSGCSDVIVTLKTDMFENSTSWILKNNLTNEVYLTSGAVGSFVKPRPEYGFIYAGIELPEIEDRGKILLLVENSLTTPLAAEIEELKIDYIKDGWRVIQREVDATDNPIDVRAMIQDLYATESELKSVFILGHVPIAYSGDIFPDTHFELRGAYPADCFYGEMDGTWTDQTVNNTTANFDIYYNTVGDGRFDQSIIPTGEVELAVGRVDFFDMPSFGSSNQDLIQQYLQKNHSFKIREFQPIRRALIDNNFNQSFAAPAASGFRNFSTMFGADSIFNLDYFSTLENESYLWSYGCGGGSIVSSMGVGNTSDFVTSDLQSVFTMLFGSQFGNWAYPDDFLRAPLASGQTLTNVWAGNPPWTFHHMAMGYNIGYSTLKTQNGNDGLYLGNGAQLIHVALMGDPTLRMHMVEPSTKIAFLTEPNAIELNWDEPIDEDIYGYHVYRADSLYGKFDRLNNDVLTDTFFTDNDPLTGENWYMVRTVKLENSASGSYFNLSLGRIDSVFFSPAITLAAGFSSSNQTVCVGDTIQFNDNSTGTITNYDWTFAGGNPSTSNLQNPTIIYNSAGSYDVSLTITDAFGDATEMKNEYIMIDDLPTAEFSYSIDNGTIQITDNSSNVNFYFWNFGDGTTSQTVGNVTHAFDSSGIYTVTLVGSNNCGPSTFETTINVTITSLENLSEWKDVFIFPNPTNDFLRISFGKKQSDASLIEVINSLGQTIFTKKVENVIEEINVSNFPKGIYFIKIMDGKSEFVKRIVVN